MDINSINIRPTVSVDNEFETNNERIESIEDWLENQLKDEEPEIFRQIGNEIRNTGYTEEYGMLGISTHFKIKSLEELVFVRCRLDRTLSDETWLSEDRVVEIEERIESLCERVAKKY